jgi:hypothetical protein
VSNGIAYRFLLYAMIAFRYSAAMSLVVCALPDERPDGPIIGIPARRRKRVVIVAREQHSRSSASTSARPLLRNDAAWNRRMPSPGLSTRAPLR